MPGGNLAGDSWVVYYFLTFLLRERMMRTAHCLPHCKLVVYSNCGHNIDTDLTEELTEEADRFLAQVEKNGKWYAFSESG